MSLHGIVLGGYRSFGAKPQFIGPLDRINLFIGANNSGKSNILRFLHQHFSEVLRGNLNKPGSAFTQLDTHLGIGPIPFTIGYARTFDDCQRAAESRRPNEHVNVLPLLESPMIQRVPGLTPKLAWFVFSAQGPGPRPALQLDEIINFAQSAAGRPTQDDWYSVWTRMTGSSHGAIGQHWIPEVMNGLANNLFQTPSVHLVPAIREVGGAGTEGENLGGLGLIERLAKLQNPEHNQQQLKERFQRINTFLKKVTENETAELEIPHNRSTITVHMDRKTLPLPSLGTGIHEVIILAAAATVIEDAILCIEEPEIHLHPILQKRLLSYLAENTSNQYFIATHSAHLMDTDKAAIFHVQMEGSGTIVTTASVPAAKFGVCRDLGYRASDLLQANSIIWVEGPSDRVYLNHWLGSFDSSLVEGIHYSIMFYGGKLLAHLSTDEEVNEFISLRSLNRNLAIIMDRDKASDSEPVNATKARIAQEISKAEGMAWITAGREVENYIEPVLLKQCLTEWPNAVALKATPAPFSDALEIDNGGSGRAVDKVKLARRVAMEFANLNVLDLNGRIAELVNFIRKANHLSLLAKNRNVVDTISPSR